MRLDDWLVEGIDGGCLEGVELGDGILGGWLDGGDGILGDDDGMEVGGVGVGSEELDLQPLNT